MGWYYYDNYDDFQDDEHTLEDYTAGPEAIILDGPVMAASRRGPIGTEWWGQQWVHAMEYLGMDGRLERGKRYARNGSVRSLEINHGIAFAQVKGSQPKPYRTAVHLRVLDDAQWQTALNALADQAIYAAKLLAGEMPGDIEAVFQSVGLSLFPRSSSEIQFECSCPDWGDPCKHAAAVYYLLAEQLDADPFILFHLRGRPRESVLSAMRALQSNADDAELEEEDRPAAPSLDADLEAFWNGPAINLVREMPIAPDKPFALRQLGMSPGRVDKPLKRIYQNISKEALRWLGIDDAG